jgi:hypothetical protein
MAKVMESRESNALNGARVRAAARNQRGCERLGAGEARHIKSVKTNPIVPSLPGWAARCAFARCGAQRRWKEKFGPSVFPWAILASWRAWRYWSYLVR